MRLVLALCVVVGCVMCGRSLAGASRRRVAALEGIAGGLRLLKIHMTSMFEPVQHALASTGCPLLERIGGVMRPGEGAGAAWRRLIARERRPGGMCDALAREDEEVLNRVFESLGEGGRDEQEVLLAGAIGGLERNLEAARRRAGEADRLYVSLGMLAGLMLALIVV